MTLVLIEPPALEPVTLGEAKTHLRVDGSSEDSLILSLIGAARTHVEAETGLALIPQPWRRHGECVGADRALTLPRHPVRQIVEVTVYDAEGAPVVLAGSQYRLDALARPARLTLEPQVDASNGVDADFTAGFGDTGVETPEPLKRAMLMLVAHWYEFRGAFRPADQPVSIPPGFDRLIAHYRRMSL